MTAFRFDDKGLDLAPGSITGATLFLESLLEEYCTVYTKDESSSRMLFEALRKKFSQWSLLPSNPMPPGVRAKHRHHLRNVVRLVMQQISQNLDENGTEDLMVEAEVDGKSVLSPIRELPELYLERQVLATSRFEAEYADVEYIAKGGFGRVYKARHLLDGNTYAVKTVLIENGEQSRVSKTLREIQTLSKLHHPNVVSYKNAWLEVNPSECPDGKGPKIVELSSESQSSLPPCPNRRQPSLKDRSCRPQNLQGGLLLKKLKPLMIPESESSSEFSLEFRGSRENEEERKSFDLSASIGGKVVERTKPVLPSLNLYIAMQFCDGTLREWLRRRNSSSSTIEASLNLGIFAQILEGLVYIHENGIIHRDLKPENIFFNQSTRRVQIGDFGLARYLGSDVAELALTPHIVALPSMEGLRLTRGLGTHSYAAPEQMAGGNYGYKCDIYSLGYVFVELFEKHFTDVSRSKCFQDLRNGVVPSSIGKHWPLVGELVGEMLDRLPELRPSAAEVYRRVEEMKRLYADSVTHRSSRALLDSSDE